MDEIIKLRAEIDKIDDKLMDLLEKRYNLTNEIGFHKNKSHDEILDTNRESYIYNKTSKYSHSPQLRYVYDVILNESKKEQGK